MKVKIIAFGIARDILYGSELVMEIRDGSTIRDLRRILVRQYPELEKLRHFSFAIEDNYQDENYPIKDNQEIVILPPVAGG